MKEFSRIVPKHKHEDWMLKLADIGDARRIIDVIIFDSKPKNKVAIEDVKHLRSLRVTYSDYHGVGILKTPYFDILVGTFPILLKENLIVRN